MGLQTPQSPPRRYATHTVTARARTLSGAEVQHECLRRGGWPRHQGRNQVQHGRTQLGGVPRQLQHVLHVLQGHQLGQLPPAANQLLRGRRADTPTDAHTHTDRQRYHTWKATQSHTRTRTDNAIPHTQTHVNTNTQIQKCTLIRTHPHAQRRVQCQRATPSQCGAWRDGEHRNSGPHGKCVTRELRHPCRPTSAGLPAAAGPQGATCAARRRWAGGPRGSTPSLCTA